MSPLVRVWKALDGGEGTEIKQCWLAAEIWEAFHLDPGGASENAVSQALRVSPAPVAGSS